MAEDRKVCRKCGRSKPLTSFSKDVSKRDEHRHYCKLCHSHQRRANRKWGMIYRVWRKALKTTYKALIGKIR